MFNSRLPDISELPTSRQLITSTFVAGLAAAGLLATIILPSEYGIDPTGFGRVLGLTKMGEIKQQLAAEAASDRRMTSATGDANSAMYASKPRSAAAARTDRKEITLAPGEAAEIKLSAVKGTNITFDWRVSGGQVNYDTHGDPLVKTRGFYHGYGKGKASSGEKGTLLTAFDGTHGWYWRNRSEQTVTISLQTSGPYSDIKRVV